MRETNTSSGKRRTRSTPIIPPTLPADALLKVDAVLLYVPVSRATWFRGVKKGIFPEPVRLKSLTFWRSKDIAYLLQHGLTHERAPRRPSRKKTTATH